MSAEQIANKNQPAIRFKGVSGEWEENTIGGIGSFYYGKSAPKWSLSDDAPTPCVRYGELYTKFGATIFETLSKTNIDPKKLRFSKGHEVLVPRVGEKPEDFGKSCSYLPIKDIAIGEMISVYETNQNPLFYTYYFHTMYMEFANAVEGKNVKNLYFRELEPLLIYKPEIKEQTQISECFKQLDHLIAQHQQKHDKLKQIKKALLEKMFPQQGASQPQIRFKGFSGDWGGKALGDLGDATSGTSIESEFSSNGIYKVVSIGSYSEKGIYTDQGIRARSSDKTIKRILKKDDLTMILNDKTASGNIIGRVLHIKEDNMFVYNQRTQRIELFKEKYSPVFVYQLLNAPLIREKIIKNSQGNTQIYVNWSSIKNLVYLIPELEEQTQIGNFFQQLDKLINQQQSQLTKLSNIKQSLLNKMFV